MCKAHWSQGTLTGTVKAKMTSLETGASKTLLRLSSCVICWKLELLQTRWQSRGNTSFSKSSSKFISISCNNNNNNLAVYSGLQATCSFASDIQWQLDQPHSEGKLTIAAKGNKKNEHFWSLKTLNPPNICFILVLFWRWVEFILVPGLPVELCCLGDCTRDLEINQDPNQASASQFLSAVSDSFIWKDRKLYCWNQWQNSCCLHRGWFPF